MRKLAFSFALVLLPATLRADGINLTQPPGVIVMEADGSPKARVLGMSFTNCTVSIVNSTAVITCSAGGGGGGSSGVTYFDGTQFVSVSTFAIPGGVPYTSLNGMATFYLFQGSYTWEGAHLFRSSMSVAIPIVGKIFSLRAETASGDSFVVWNDSVVVGPGQPFLTRHQLRASELGANGTSGIAFGPGGAFGEQSGFRYDLSNDNLIFRTNGGKVITLRNNGTGTDFSAASPLTASGGTAAAPAYGMNVGGNKSGIYAGGDASVLFSVQNVQVGGFENGTGRLNVFAHILTPYVNASSVTAGQFFFNLSTLIVTNSGQTMTMVFPSTMAVTADGTNLCFQITPSSTIILAPCGGSGSASAGLPLAANDTGYHYLSSSPTATGSLSQSSMSILKSLYVAAGGTPSLVMDPSSRAVLNTGQIVANGVGSVLLRGATMGIFGPAPNGAYAFVVSSSPSTELGNYAVVVTTTNHFSVAGGSPTVSSCGTAPNGALIRGSDQAGIISIGGGVAVLSCTLTFQTPFKNVPSCTVSDNNAAISPAINSATNSTVTFGFSASLGGGLVYYSCFPINE